MVLSKADSLDAKKLEDLDQIIADENLNRDETYRFVEEAFKSGSVRSTGTAMGGIAAHVDVHCHQRARQEARNGTR